MVIDLKTGAHVAWHKHQLAAYAVALEWETGILPMGGIAVYTKDNGRYTTKPYQDTAWQDAIYEWKEMVQKYKEKMS
jgi:CRISPR/Cas system-associated exonuclease Cas4 (RecB family)